MTLSRVLEIVIVLVGVGFLAYSAVRGFQRRRPYWTQQSWWRFGAVCAFGFILAAVGIAMAGAVDRGLFRTTITTPDARSYYILGSLAVLFLGAGTIGGALSWFALGAPERAFPGVRTSIPSADAGTA